MVRANSSAKVVSRPRRPSSVPGAEAGAAELGRRIANTLKERRRVLGLSLDALARSSGVSRATLSQIETCATNPTLNVLWKVAAGLAIPFSELLGHARDAASLMRRSEGDVLHSPDGKFESRPLARATAAGVDVYELRLAGHSSHAADAHGKGTRELIVVLTGSLRMTVGTESYVLGIGDSLVFTADQPHVYENPAAPEARYHDVIVYRQLAAI
jgi:transcriptional regulator with XRE-family HTH domain